MSHILSENELEASLSGLPGWSVEGDALLKTFTFPSFREAVAAIVRISYEAEDNNHHPELRNCFNTLEIRLSTHDAGGKITDKDAALAALIEKVLGEDG